MPVEHVVLIVIGTFAAIAVIVVVEVWASERYRKSWHDNVGSDPRGDMQVAPRWKPNKRARECKVCKGYGELWAWAPLKGEPVPEKVLCKCQTK